MLSPVPIFSIRRAGSTEQFRGPRDSASIALLDFGDLRAGPVAKFVAARKQYSYSELNGLGDVKAAVQLGGFVEYYPVDWFRTRVELRHGVVGPNGTVADFSADFIVPVFQRLTLSAGPRLTWESTQATSPYFGIDAVQAMASGLPIFNAKGGAHSYGVGAQVSYRINLSSTSGARRRGRKPSRDHQRFAEPDRRRHWRLLFIRLQNSIERQTSQQSTPGLRDNTACCRQRRRLRDA